MNNKYEDEINFKISKDVIIKDYKNKITELSKNLKISGFRKGLIPKNIIENKFGTNIKNSIINKYLKEKIINYLRTFNIKILDYPKIKNKLEDDENYIFIIKLLYLPNIEIKIDNINILEYDFEITQSDIEKEINLLKMKYSNWKKISDNTKINDIVNIDLYEIHNDTKKYILKNLNIKIDENNYFIKNLKYNLKEKFKKKEYKLNFENNEIKDNKNANTVDVILYINEIIRKEYYDNDNLCLKKLKFKDDITDSVKKNLNDVGLFLIKKIKKDQIFKALVKNNDFEIPLNLIEKKKKTYVQNNLEFYDELKLNLILISLKDKFNIIISDEEIIKRKNFMYKNITNIKINQLDEYIENEIFLEKILNLIEKEAIKSYKKITFENLIKIGNFYD